MEHDRLPLVIECVDHKLAPWAIVCDHLIDGTRTDAKPVDVDDGREVEFDWCCGACYEQHMAGNDPVDYLQTVCIHCLREIRQMRGW